MIKVCWRLIRWFCSCGILLWFIGTPLLPLYGWFSPWPAANDRLKEEGFGGVRLMIGTGSSARRVGERWEESRYRAFVVLPESLRQMAIVSYEESSGSAITGVKKKFSRSRLLIPLFLLWIIAGMYSVSIALPWAKKTEPNQSLQPTAPSRRG
jgi:hypothetical protein